MKQTVASENCFTNLSTMELRSRHLNEQEKKSLKYNRALYYNHDISSTKKATMTFLLFFIERVSQVYDIH
jgi:hypothetical protein